MEEIKGVLEEIPIHRIVHGTRQLRVRSQNLDDLARSIRDVGLLCPIIVRAKDENLYEVVAGNRRFAACSKLGLRIVPCYVMELDDKEAFELAITENIQRETFTPIEEAKAFKTYMMDVGWGGITELASKIGKSTSYISKKIRLLDLPPDVLESLCKAELSVSTAEELMLIKNPSRVSELADLISKRRLTLKTVRELLHEENGKGKDDFHLLSNPVREISSKQKLIDKFIIVLRLTLIRLGPIIDDAEEEWMLHEILMHHKNMLHSQIDLLIKEKKKAKKLKETRIFRYRKIQ